MHSGQGFNTNTERPLKKTNMHGRGNRGGRFGVAYIKRLQSGVVRRWDHCTGWLRLMLARQSTPFIEEHMIVNQKYLNLILNMTFIPREYYTLTNLSQLELM